jgi:hypothetical protein
LRDIGDARIEIDEPSESPVTVRRHRYLPWTLAAVASGIAVWSFLRPEAEQERVVSRLTVNLSRERALTDSEDPTVALFPDGGRLVYVGGGDNDRKLYIRPLGELEARPIPGTEGASTALFSPDGGWVGFYDGGKLKKVRLDGGIPIAPDGKLLLYSERMPTGQFDIGLLTLEGERKAHPFLQSPFNEAGGVFSPDGRFLAYVSDESGRNEVYVRPWPTQIHVVLNWFEELKVRVPTAKR